MDSTTKAYINLYAILRNLEDLCRLDEETARLAEEEICMQMTVAGGPAGYFKFGAGSCAFKAGKAERAQISLRFPTCQRLNDMCEGKANPGIAKGFTKLKFLTGNFIKMTDRLAYFLKPTDELLKDERYFAINTELTVYTAIFALCQIGNHDELGKLNASRVPDGIINVEVSGGPLLHITVANGRLSAAKGVHDKPRAIMRFGDMRTANRILNGAEDIYTAIGEGMFSICGYIPMLDNLSRLLNQVGPYVR